MDSLLAVVYLLTCVLLMIRMIIGKNVLDCHLGVIGAFSLGYYPLPVLVKSISNLDYYPESIIFEALLIHWLFLVFLIIGTNVGRYLFTNIRPLKVPPIDNLLHKYRLFLSIIAFGIYITYYSTQSLTSYSSDDFEAYFSERGRFVAVIAAFGAMSLAYLAVSLSASWKAGDRTGLLVIGGMFIVSVALTLTLGQRLIIISPIFVLLASLYASGQRDKAIRILGAAVILLLFVSPISVYIRENRADRAVKDNVLQGFSYSDGLVATSFRSIVDRADLIFVTINMKRYIDLAPPPSLTYYLSVLAIPIPKIILPGKPYVLSDDGTPSGELSIWAWRVLHGGTGSLTAFGGLYAYREGGWVWICFNGLLAGMLFAAIARWLGGAATLGRFFYSFLFIGLAVKKVPPSFFEALAECMTALPFIVFAILVGFAWTHLPRQDRNRFPPRNRTLKVGRQ